MGHILHPPRVPLRRLPLMQICIFIDLVAAVTTSSSAAMLAPPPVFGNTTDHLALLSFKSLISHDPSGALATWNETLHFCRWRGVTCGRRHAQRVVALDLADMYLVGTLSPSLANLTFLRRLRLPKNRLGGRLPLEFGRLFRLQYLNLGSNALTGEIPANLSRCANLRLLNLMENMITGEIPSELGSLSRLEKLGLSLNMITGRIPSSMGNLSSVSVFYLAANRLEGSIPTELGNIVALQNFSVQSNMLSGSVPPFLYNVSSLRLIEVGDNRLSGTLPPDLGRGLPQLERFSMFQNQIAGHLPLSFPNASRLREIELNTNNFVGVIPPNLGALQSLSRLLLGDNQLEAADWSFLSGLANCSRLEWLALEQNELEGTLPTSIANISTQLQVLTVAANSISGGIPSDIGKFVRLFVLGMENNLLTGPIPDTVGRLQGMMTLAFNLNELSGVIPSSLGNLTRLARLYLYQNNLEGGIPTSFRKYRFLELLDLSHNKLSGEIPREVLGLQSLSLYLNLSHNLFIGSLPAEVSSLKNLATLDISENKLSGEIPTSLGDCQVLEYLFMDGNAFLGSIPSSLSKLRGLQVLDLSRNHLSGTIPEFFQSLPYLRLLNLSFNNLEGELPKGGVFQNCTLGNQKLCGGDPNLHLPRCPIPDLRNKHRRPPKLTILVIVPPALVACCAVFLFVFIRCRTVLSSRKESPRLASENDVQYKRISYRELLKATDGFSKENLLGEGSFGSVYKGILDEGAKIVAVKVLKLQQRGALKSFMAECEALRSIRHRNLLKIITSCSSLDSQGNEFKALVFEFMANGSLESWLHRPKGGEGNPSLHKLNFLQRLNIAIDVASALDYLHNHGETPIIHCDLKPSNILLDSDNCGHVGDFGLSRFILEKSKEQSKLSLTTGSIGIKGSIGYIAPEYGTGSRPCTSGDVYSYGVVLLEMFTGKRPTDEIFREGLNLHKYVEMAFPTRIVDVVDPHLLSLHDDLHGGGADGEIQDVVLENCREERLLLQQEHCLVSVVKVGLLCSKESPEERAEMRDVVKEMTQIRDAFVLG